MIRPEQLQNLAEAYLQFLITRDESGLKPFFSLDFQPRQRVSQQIKLIKALPAALNYGLSPEAQIWSDYSVEQENGTLFISPFQFHIMFKNLMNPLVTETMTVTLHKLIYENSEWRIHSVLNDVDHDLLINYSSQNTVSPAGENTGTHPLPTTPIR